MKRALVRRPALLGMVAMIGVLLVRAPAVSAATGVPYNDPRVVGSIGLCNAAGQAVTKGSIHDAPFVTKAIDSTAAAAPYNGAGETATLFIYQPRQNIQPVEWHGEQISASSRSSSPQHPTAIVTAGDGPLAAALADYPPQWNGLMQLRIYLGAPNQPIFNSNYDATDIAVSGDTWQVVRGASVSCGDGQSVSLEQALASKFPQLTASPTPPGGTAGSASSSGKAGGVASTASAGASGPVDVPTSGGAAAAPGSGAAISGRPDSAAGADQASTVAGKDSGPGLVLWLLVVVGVVGLAVAAVQWRRSNPAGKRRA